MDTINLTTQKSYHTTCLLSTAFALSPADIPVFDSNRATLINGWFSETLPIWAAIQDRSLSFIHIDCDLYESTKDVLFNLNSLIVPGTLILFDEYLIRYKGAYVTDEHRALLDFSASFDRSFEYLWRTKWAQVAIRIVK